MTTADAKVMPQDGAAAVDSVNQPRTRRWPSALHPVLFAAYPVLFLW